MKIPRLAYDPSQLLEFYEEGLVRLGALCERTWHDRLQVIAEGTTAALFQANAELCETELQFTAADATTARDAAREVFPGCPLTFRLVEALVPGTLNLERFVLAGPLAAAPDAAVAEKLWRTQFPETQHWRMAGVFRPGWHFSIVAVVRSEIQAIDQHWSLHRLAVSVPRGETDDDLARNLVFYERGAKGEEIPWPAPDLASWRAAVEGALLRDVAEDLARVRARQEKSLQRELDRIDDYFAKYERELSDRRSRGGEAAQAKKADRLAAARAEHARRRDDQVYRHEIRIVPHVDALLLVGERAWQAEVRFDQARQTHTVAAAFLPRSRRWARL